MNIDIPVERIVQYGEDGYECIGVKVGTQFIPKDFIIKMYEIIADEQDSM